MSGKVEHERLAAEALAGLTDAMVATVSSGFWIFLVAYVLIHVLVGL